MLDYLRLSSLVSFYPQEALCIPQSGFSSPYSPKCVEKLFGKLGWVPDLGSESRQDGSKGPRSATSCCQRSVVERPPAIFQTVSPCIPLNKNLKLDGASLKTLARRSTLGPIKRA